MNEKKITFLKNNNIDVDTGIKNTIDFETYDEILNDFFISLPDELTKLEGFINNNDMVNYSINVHALKSNAKTLGFTNMGEYCYQHEIASKENNLDYIKNNFITLKKIIIDVYNIITEYKKV